MISIEKAVLLCGFAVIATVLVIIEHRLGDGDYAVFRSSAAVVLFLLGFLSAHLVWGAN